MVNASDSSLVCHRCKVLPEQISDEGRPDRIRCSKCGITADLDATIKDAASYAAAEMVQKQLAKTFRSSKDFTHKPGRTGRAPDFTFSGKPGRA